MEEILASIRRIIEDSDPAPRDEPKEQETEAASSSEQVDAFRAGLVEHEEQREEARPAASGAGSLMGLVATPRSEAPRVAEVRPLRPAEPVFRADAPAPTVAEDDFPPEDAPTPRGDGAHDLPSILSEQAGRQVAAAFGELSEALAASRRRSFDDIAMELMRPMLQEWLDNNLPTLVERLVREEIERVARGC